HAAALAHADAARARAADRAVAGDRAVEKVDHPGGGGNVNRAADARAARRGVGRGAAVRLVRVEGAVGQQQADVGGAGERAAVPAEGDRAEAVGPGGDVVSERAAVEVE